jgi:hypothetical protein
VKVRKGGNSNVVSILRELKKSGYAPGASVLVEELADGELRIIPTDRVRERIREVGRRVVAEHPDASRSSPTTTQTATAQTRNPSTTRPAPTTSRAR